MMTKEENELLTRTGRGTPCGELLRRYWQPVALSAELPAAAAPLSVRFWAKIWCCSATTRGESGFWGSIARTEAPI